MDVLRNKEKERIVNLGKQAAYDGKAKCVNPYQEISEQREAWLLGWHQAVSELQEEKELPVAD